MTDELVRALLVGLAAWRLASLISTERGPFGVFEGFRELVFPLQGDGIAGLRLELWRLLECVWCTSIWTAAGLWLLYPAAPWAVAILAGAATAVALERWVRP